MAIHSPECQQVLAELLSTPIDSIDHRVAEYVDSHSAAEGLDLVLAVILDDAPEDTQRVRKLFAPLNAEVDPIRSLKLMHYQAEPLTFDPSRVYEQRERSSHTKPVGFWVSVAGEDDWPAWCRGEEFRTDTLAVAHEVRLRDSANIRLVSSVEEIDQFHNEFAAPTDFDLRYNYGLDQWGIDWSMVVRQYDGIVIAPYLWERRLGRTCGWYYTWDCASGCIWNLDAIESVTVASEVA